MLQSRGYNMQYSDALAPNKGWRRESAGEARKSDPHSAAEASSPAARRSLSPRRERGSVLTSASASCQLCGLAPLSVPTSHRRCQCRLVSSRCFDGKCQHLSPRSVHAFRSHDSGSDASAVGGLVTTHRVTPRAAVYQRSSPITEEEVRGFSPASKCSHSHHHKIK